MGILRRGGIISESTSVPNPVNIENLLHLPVKYSNHLGNVDNYTQTGTAGGGTATETAASHRMVLLTANNAISNARFITKLSFSPTGRYTIITARLFQTTADLTIQDFIYFGLKTNFANQTTAAEDIIMFRGNNYTWNGITQIAGGGTTNISLSNIPIADAVFSLVLTTTKVYFYIDGLLAGMSVTNLPTDAMYIGAGIYCTDNLSAAAIVGVDYISIEEFYS